MIGLIAKIGKHIGGGAVSPYIDFTEFTVVDQNSDFTITQHKIDVDTMRRDAVSYIYKDYGVDAIDNFELQFEAEVTVSGLYGNMTFACISNTIGTRQDQINANDGITIQTYGDGGDTDKTEVQIQDDNLSNSDLYNPGLGSYLPLWYYTWIRSGTTLVLNVFSDSDRSVLVDTLIITCVSTPFRYLHAVTSRENASSGANTVTGYVQNMQLFLPEDLTTFTEVDPAGDFTQTTQRCTWTTLNRDAAAYVYKDYGANYFGDFIIHFQGAVTACGSSVGFCSPFAMGNTIGTRTDMQNANDGINFYFYCNSNNMDLGLQEHITDTVDNYTPGGASLALRYFTISRVGAVVTCKIYSDVARQTLLDTLSVTASADKWRYLYCAQSPEVSGAYAQSGYSQNFYIEKAA